MPSRGPTPFVDRQARARSHPRIARPLKPRLERANVDVSGQDVWVHFETELNEASVGGAFMPVIEEVVSQDGDIDEPEAEAWAGDLSWEKTPHFGRHVPAPLPFTDRTAAVLPTSSLTITVREGTDGWRWEAFDGGPPVLTGTERHATRLEALAALDGLRWALAASPDSPEIEVHEADDGWRWQIVDDGGALVAGDRAHPTRDAATGEAIAVCGADTT